MARWVAGGGRLSEEAMAAASLAAVEDAGAVAPTGTWHFALAPTIDGDPIDIGGSTVTTTSQSGTAYTYVLADANTLVEHTNAAATTVTIPPNSAVAFPAGTSISGRAYGAGQVTVTAGAGVTLRSRGGAFKSGGQYAEWTATKRATDEWIVTGDLTT